MLHKTEIEIELKETIAYRYRQEKIESYCPICKSMVEMAPPQVVAFRMQTTEREIYRLVESGHVHFTETDRVLVCMKSFKEIEGEI